LVTIALAGGECAIERDYAKYNPLEQRVLTEVIHHGSAYNTHKLTRAGIKAVLDLPNNYRQGSYPLPRDIVKAKSIVRELFREWAYKQYRGTYKPFLA
jgi:uncharacterized protein YbgA (DUF1722 family)